jgi:hypothetical protein
MGAHRYVWQQANGPIPNGLVVRHKCDNPACVNLDHLELGTQADNMADRVNRNRVNPARDVDLPQTRIPAETIPLIRARLASGEYQKDIAKEFGVNQSTISRLAKRAA